MKRLTTNKEVSEMNIIELAHNSCYTKDENARYRYYDTDIDARQLTMKLLEKFTDIPNEFISDDDFDDFMLDSLQYGAEDSVQGLIAAFYRNLWAMADLRERLKKYEDLDEQGKLPKLPCAVRDTIYLIYPDEDNGGFSIDEMEVVEVSTQRIWVDSYCFDCDDVGKIVFFDREKAELALKEMEGEN